MYRIHILFVVMLVLLMVALGGTVGLRQPIAYSQDAPGETAVASELFLPFVQRG